MTKDRLIKQFIEACKGARNHLEACMAGKIRNCGKSASYPLVVKVLEDADAFLADPHMTVGQLMKQLSKCDWEALVFVGTHNKDMIFDTGLDTNPAISITENRQSVHEETGISCVHITSV